jgi:hypothetical protein
VRETGESGRVRVVKNLLRMAAARVPGHWYQGDMSDGRGNYCGLGHLVCVASDGRGSMVRSADDEIRLLADVTRQAALDKFPERVAVTSMSLDWFPFTSFNDHPETTEQDVVAVMELAADRWDVEHGG